MKKLLFFLIITVNFATAQNQRFAYEYKFITDSTNKENVIKELMYLDITKDGSKFYSREVYVSDSTNNAFFEKEIKATGSMNVDMRTMKTNGLVHFKIFKISPDYITYFVTQVG
ncbi:MAG: GLPGLI family protein, partial [Flavobacterium sp.]|nr:GLPGLI family protein [Flavobacterium sp.]